MNKEQLNGEKLKEICELIAAGKMGDSNLEETIKRLMKVRGLTTASLAEKMGVSASTISRRLRYPGEFRYAEIVKLSEIFEINPVYLINKKPTPAKPTKGEASGNPLQWRVFDDEELKALKGKEEERRFSILRTKQGEDYEREDFEEEREARQAFSILVIFKITQLRQEATPPTEEAAKLIKTNYGLDHSAELLEAFAIDELGTLRITPGLAFSLKQILDGSKGEAGNA